MVSRLWLVGLRCCNSIWEKGSVGAKDPEADGIIIIFVAFVLRQYKLERFEF
jgi:hypothetical protein